MGVWLRALRDAYRPASFHRRDDHGCTGSSGEERTGLECSSPEGAATARIVFAEGPEAAAASDWRLSIAARRAAGNRSLTVAARLGRWSIRSGVSDCAMGAVAVHPAG